MDNPILESFRESSKRLREEVIRAMVDRDVWAPDYEKRMAEIKRRDDIARCKYRIAELKESLAFEESSLRYMLNHG